MVIGAELKSMVPNSSSDTARTELCSSSICAETVDRPSSRRSLFANSTTISESIPISKKSMVSRSSSSGRPSTELSSRRRIALSTSGRSLGSASFSARTHSGSCFSPPASVSSSVIKSANRFSRLSGHANDTACETSNRQTAAWPGSSNIKASSASIPTVASTPPTPGIDRPSPFRSASAAMPSPNHGPQLMLSPHSPCARR